MSSKLSSELTDKLLKEARKCLYCGFCEAVCPTLPFGLHRGYGPRGRTVLVIEALSGRQISNEVLSSLYSCLGCGACRIKCPASIDVGALAQGVKALHLKGLVKGAPKSDQVVVKIRRRRNGIHKTTS